MQSVVGLVVYKRNARDNVKEKETHMLLVQLKKNLKVNEARYLLPFPKQNQIK